VHGSTSVAGGRTPGATPGQGIQNRSDRANEVAQNVYNNKNLQGEFSDPDSPYYQGDGTGTDENGQPIGNCNEINAGCTAGQEELEDYTGDEIVIIGSSGESLYYYHPDHLGSASVITDGNGNLREHTEYFAFGETWVQEGASKKTPFMYTGKELDQETGLYYYGARYYDPRTSVWQSVDPILEKYLPSGDPEKDKNLPGMGGVFNPINLSVYAYSHHNPVSYLDPDGNEALKIQAYDQKLTPHQRKAIIAVNDIKAKTLIGLMDTIGSMQKSPDGLLALRDAVPAYEGLHDMDIQHKISFGNDYDTSGTTDLMGMIQDDAENKLFGEIGEFLVGITPDPVSKVKKGIDVLLNIQKAVSAVGNATGHDSTDKANLLLFYGSQVEK